MRIYLLSVAIILFILPPLNYATGNILDVDPIYDGVPLILSNSNNNLLSIVSKGNFGTEAKGKLYVKNVGKDPISYLSFYAMPAYLINITGGNCDGENRNKDILPEETCYYDISYQSHDTSNKFVDTPVNFTVFTLEGAKDENTLHAESLPTNYFYQPGIQGMDAHSLSGKPIDIVTANNHGAKTSYAVSEDGKVFKSTDSGQNWQCVLSNGLPDNVKIRAVLYADRAIYVGTLSRGIYKSIDGGQTWKQANDGVTYTQINTLVYANGIIYAGVEYGGVLENRDGKRWIPINGGLTKNEQIRLLAYDDESRSMYAITNDNQAYKLKDGGQNWISVNSGLSGLDISSLIYADGSMYIGTFNKGIYKNTYGQNWIPVDIGLPKNAGVISLLYANGVIYAGTESWGVFKSTDGKKWVAINDGLPQPYLSVNSLISVNDNIYLIHIHNKGAWYMIFKSTNGGQLWKMINNGLADNPGITSLIDVNNSIYAGTETLGVYKSTDGGQNWEFASNGLPYERGDVETLLYANGALYAGIVNDRVYKSTDDGKNWIASGLAGKEFFFTSLYVNGTIFIGTEKGVYGSTNGGRKWREVNNGLPKNREIHSLLSVNGSLYAGTDERGIYKRLSGGRWKAVNNGLPQDATVEALLYANGVIYAGVDRHGVYKSLNSGQTWVQVNNGLPDDSDIIALSYANGVIYAGINYYGVYVSTNSGQKWTVFNNGLPFPNANTLVLAFLHTDNTLYTATSSKDGFFKALLDSDSVRSGRNPGQKGLFVS